MRETDSSNPESSTKASARKRLYWLLGSVAALACVLGLFWEMQRRAQAAAREQARAEALRDMEQAQRDAQRVRKNLRQALDRMDQEQQRIEKENRRTIDHAGLTQDGYLENKALRAGDPVSEPAGRGPRPSPP